MNAVIQNFRRSFGPSTMFFWSLSLDLSETIEELYRRVDRYSLLEDNIRAATYTIMITNQLAEGNMPPRKKHSEPKEGKSRDQK